jgi:hypothetical protein
MVEARLADVELTGDIRVAEAIEALQLDQALGNLEDAHRRIGSAPRGHDLKP